MNRFVVGTAATLLGGLAMVGVSACNAQDGLDATTQPTASGTATSNAGGGSGQAGTGTSHGGSGSGTGSGTGSGSGSDAGSGGQAGGTSGGSGGSAQGGSGSGGSGAGAGSGGSAPKITASLTCVVTGHESFPGEPNVPLYQPELSWSVTNATGMALSIDNPGVVGSYGTYSWHGTLLLGSGCYKGEGDHTLVLSTVGGSGPRADLTIHEQPTMIRPSAPPFAYPTPKATATS